MFKNEPLADFSIAENRARFQDALASVTAASHKGNFAAVPIIDGKESKSGTIVDSINPSRPAEVVGQVCFGSIAEAERALESVKRGKTAWARTPFERRAEIIRKVGAIVRSRKQELAALILLEAGKSWREADADVAETIDFCEYYADEMLKFGPTQRMGDVPGELNHYFYKPRGIAVVISPWNFPLAIACGMTVAALVTGNATILKPAEQTSLVAAELARIILAAGVPADAFAFLPGIGEEVGAFLVASPEVDVICFTGSKDVGLHIIKEAAVLKPGQNHVKRVIAEMGGKNAIIIDEDADLDEAIKGVLYSAFGYSGQKCSACSRLIVVGDAYEPMMKRLVEAAASIPVGDVADPKTIVGPVIDEVSWQRIRQTIARDEQEQTLAYRGTAPETGYFIAPHIFRDVKTDRPLWREEIFGPVLGCVQAKNFDEALALANDCQYALTGAIFSRSPAHIERARIEFEVGNFYINRGTTGALVYRQPFGGFKLSGIGSKAGGPDYLLQFMEPRTVVENTMRRGFAP